MTRKIVKRSIFFLFILDSTKQSNTTSATGSPNYNVNIMTNNIPSSQPQSSNGNKKKFYTFDKYLFVDRYS